MCCRLKQKNPLHLSQTKFVDHITNICTATFALKWHGNYSRVPNQVLLVIDIVVVVALVLVLVLVDVISSHSRSMLVVVVLAVVFLVL